MSDILLLEPNYKNKYPPLGLMKISTYHKEHKKDFVRFAKGQLPEVFKNKKWDRVYVTTLFTFEWEEILKTIKYAVSIAKDQGNVFVGGIAATLLKDELEKETGIKPIPGLLNQRGKLGYEDDHIIDCLTPDYAILDDIKDHYRYPFENGYFMYTTRGCGMNCGFCAVKTLEPVYIDRISIKKQIIEIDNKFGAKKDLLLMDNNVLKSAKFFEIVDEIKELGFAKGASYINPLTKKKANRFVDFNQGLDAFCLTEEKAKKLAELAIRPARIAFDHIEDEETYQRAIKLCAKYGITELSNYILYNAEDFSGKGNKYHADTPGDLYRRLRLTLDLKEEINASLPKDKKIAIFSFPMRFIPLDAKKRGYVGSEWCEKYLRAVQTMLIPTQGKGVSGKGFFEADFGKDFDEFIETLLMPESLIASRGVHQSGTDKTEDDKNVERQLREKKEEENWATIAEWKRLFLQLSTEKEQFIEIIKKNVFGTEQFNKLPGDVSKKLFLHYLTERKFLLTIRDIDDTDIIDMIFNYSYHEFNLYFQKIIKHLYYSQVPRALFPAFVSVFKEVGIKALLMMWVEGKYENDYLLNSLEADPDILIKYGLDINIIKIFKSYINLNALADNQVGDANNYIIDLDTVSLKNLLIKNYEPFKKAAFYAISDEVGQSEMAKQIDIITSEIYKQLTLF